MSTGKVIGRCCRRHWHKELLTFLEQVDATLPPDGDVHVIMDNFYEAACQVTLLFVGAGSSFQTHLH